MKITELVLQRIDTMSATTVSVIANSDVET